MRKKAVSALSHELSNEAQTIASYHKLERTSYWTYKSFLTIVIDHLQLYIALETVIYWNLIGVKTRKSREIAYIFALCFRINFL